jgi:hypothetical protein
VSNFGECAQGQIGVEIGARLGVVEVEAGEREAASRTQVDGYPFEPGPPDLGQHGGG